MTQHIKHVDLPEAGRGTPRNLIKNPLWREEDLGKPIPDSPHAVSVALPLWEHVIGYEEEAPAVMDALACGYPRFFLHPSVQSLFQRCAERFAGPDETALAFPSERIARRCAEFIEANTGIRAHIHAIGAHDVHAVVFARGVLGTAKKFWRHAGELVSSRLAEAIVHGLPAPSGGAEAKAALRIRLAAWAGVSPDGVYLYPSGMAALMAAQRMLHARKPGVKTVQLGFPYVDLLKIQSRLGPGSHFLGGTDAENHAALEKLLAEAPAAGVFCEFPGNPLLQTADLDRLSKLLRRHEVPLIIDETLGGFVNVDLRRYADALVTSLTKYVAGTGDVLAGSLILVDDSPFRSVFADTLAEQYEDVFWDGDALAIEASSRDFPTRMRRINTTAAGLCQMLREHPAVERLYYPEPAGAAHFAPVMRPGGGYGGLFSMLLRGGEAAARRFYDRLQVSKGPSLGTNFTLVCPYVLLAHYEELDWAEAQGVPRNLIRVSVGLEDLDDLKGRFTEALRGL